MQHQHQNVLAFLFFSLLPLGVVPFFLLLLVFFSEHEGQLDRPVKQIIIKIGCK